MQGFQHKETFKKVENLLKFTKYENFSFKK